VQTPYGLSSLCYVLVAFAVGLAAGTATTRPTFGFQAATALLGGVGGTLLFAGLGTLIGQPSVPRHQLVVIVAVVSVACVLLANLAYRLLEWAVAVAPGAHHDAGAFAGGSARRATRALAVLSRRTHRGTPANPATPVRPGTSEVPLPPVCPSRCRRRTSPRTTGVIGIERGS